MTDNQKLLCALLGEPNGDPADRTRAQVTPFALVTALLGLRPVTR